MDRKTKMWIGLMNFFEKYWGCHQMPERSFFIKGFQFPICARCTGIIIGELIAVLLSIAYRKYSIFVLTMLFPMTIDGMVQFFTPYTSTNIRRLLTGILFGFSFLYTILIFIIHIAIYITH